MSSELTKLAQRRLMSIYPEEMIDDNISVISMDTTICETEDLKKHKSHKSNKFDTGVLYAENLELKELNSNLKKMNENLRIQVNKLTLKLSNKNQETEIESRIKHYKQSLTELSAQYDKISKENEMLINQNKCVDSLFKIMEINNKYGYKLPIPNPKDNRQIVVDKITQIVGNDIILTECRTSPLQQWQGNNKDKVQIGDIVLLDITDCYNRIIIHKFSQAEKHVIINLPTEEYRKVNPLHPMEQATDLNSLGMIKGLYKSITSH